MTRNIKTTYGPRGVDLRSMHPVRSDQGAVDGLNFDITSTGNLTKRPGYAMKADSDLGYGLAKYEEWTATTADVPGWGEFSFGLDAWGSPDVLGYGTISPKLVGIAATPKVWTVGTLSITYSGAGAATFSIGATSETDIKLILSVDGSAVLTSDLGTGIEGSPVTLATLKTAIDAVSDFAATITGTTTTPAAFLDWYDTTSLTSGTAYDVGFGYWSTPNTIATDPLGFSESRVTESDYEHATYVNMNGVLYISNGYDPMVKYDGQTLYEAGLSNPSDMTTPSVTGVSVAGGFSGSYRYLYRYKYTDNKENTVISAATSLSTAVDNSSGPYAIDVTVDNLVAASGYHTSCAVINGTQSSVNAGSGLETLTVDDGSGGTHTLKVGETAYFKEDNIGYVTAVVSAVTSTTVTVEYVGTLDVTDNNVISSNLRIQIYRTEAGGTIAKLVEEIPNNSFDNTQTYRDTLIDASLGSSYVEPIKVPSPPPNCKYMNVWRNQLVMSGAPGDPTGIYYSEFSDTVTPENFPSINRIEITPEFEGSIVSGIAVLGRNQIIFTEDSIYIVEGNLADDQVRIDLLTDDVGCVAHATIKKIENTIVFLSKKGVYRISQASGGHRVDLISQQLDPLFRLSADPDYSPYYKRARAVTWDKMRKYVLYMPIEETIGTSYATSDSKCYVFDYSIGEWFIWDNINASGGMVIFNDGDSDDVIWFHSRESGPEYRLHRFNNTGTEVDYADHTAGVSFNYQTQWEFGGDPRGYKVYTDLVLDSYVTSAETDYTPTGDMTINIYRDFNDATSEVSFTAALPSNDQQSIYALPRSARRAISFKLSNSTINKQVLLSGWSYEMFMYLRDARR